MPEGKLSEHIMSLLDAMDTLTFYDLGDLIPTISFHDEALTEFP